MMSVHLMSLCLDSGLSFCVPLVAMVRSSRVTMFVAKCILLMLVSPYKLIHSSRVFDINGSNGRKLFDMFDVTLFPRLQDDEEIFR